MLTNVDGIHALTARHRYNDGAVVEQRIKELGQLSAGRTAAATILRYYMSAASVGSDAISALPAGAGSNESIALTAPLTAGTYPYSACVDAVSPIESHYSVATK